VRTVRAGPFLIQHCNIGVQTAIMIERIAGMFRACATVALCAAVLSQPVFAQTDGIAPEALKLLKASTDFLGDQKQFSLDTSSTIEVVLSSGQKIQFDHTATQSVRRPDGLRAERTGDLVDQVFYYDGKSLTLHNPGQNYYASIDAPDTLDAMLDFAREKLDIVAPAADLLFTNAFEILTEDVVSGFVVGKAVVEGVRCDHLAFRAPHADWQIWIEEGDRPLPRKLVITTRDMVNAPQFSVVMTGWDLSPNLTDLTFAFTPPDGAVQGQFIIRDAGESGTR